MNTKFEVNPGGVPEAIDLSALNVSVDWVVFVDHVDGFAPYGKFNLDCTTAVVRRNQMMVQLGTFRVVLGGLFLLPLVGLPVLVLQAVLADISESCAIATGLGIISTSLRVFESFSLFNGCYDGSWQVVSTYFRADVTQLPTLIWPFGFLVCLCCHCLDTRRTRLECSVENSGAQ